jgi:ParB-like chromosome segregation protein Spo0J
MQQCMPGGPFLFRKDRVMTDEHQSLASLTPDPRNARRHTDRNLATIEASLHEVGAARSIVVDEAGVILAGNATVQAAANVGITTVRVVDVDGTELVAVRRTGLTPDQKQRLALFDNRAADLASWDEAMLAALSAETDLSGLWTDDELAEIVARAEPPVVDFPEYDEAAAEAVSWATCPECGHRFPK